MSVLRRWSARLAFAVGTACAVLTTTTPSDSQTPGTVRRQARLPLPIEGKDGLYQRIIVRPGAVAAERPEANAPGKPIPGFSVFYVYERQGHGTDSWVEIGSALDGRTEGWIDGAKTIEWKHNLVLAFNNPAGRERAMFFADADVPRRLWLDTETRAGQAMRYRNEAMTGTNGPVIALEPDSYVDITRRFYFLPVLSAEQITASRDEKARLLEVISAPAPAAGVPISDADALRSYKGAVVFLVDSTVSMGPYIQQTREAIRRIIERIQNTELGNNFRFGLIAYRDHMGGNQALEYVTLPAYLPNFAEPAQKVLDNLNAVQEAKASNRDFDEDAIAGLKIALDKVAWQDFGGRYIILITDAGTRDATDPLSETRLGIPEIKAIARSEAKQVAIYAIHLMTPEGGPANHARAERQYKELTDYGAAGSLYYPVPGGGAGPFRQIADYVSDNLLAQVAQTVGRPIVVAAPQTETERQIARQASIVGTAMRLSYLGRSREQTMPDIIRSFVLDEDPADPIPARKPLDVRVLITKNQLSDLAKTARTVIDAANANRLSPENFFDQVRAATTATVRDPRRIAESQRLAGLFADFIKDLPYESPIMEITPEQWRDGMAPSERREIVNALEGKLRLYEELNGQPSLWVGFDGRQGTGEAFYPLPIDQLP